MRRTDKAHIEGGLAIWCHFPGMLQLILNGTVNATLLLWARRQPETALRSTCDPSQLSDSAPTRLPCLSGQIKTCRRRESCPVLFSGEVRSSPASFLSFRGNSAQCESPVAWTRIGASNRPWVRSARWRQNPWMLPWFSEWSQAVCISSAVHSMWWQPVCDSLLVQWNTIRSSSWIIFSTTDSGHDVFHVL